ncbi:hypothetical protein VTH8203_00832 [Vibrio thalassae]|uniref:Uncharacterized protein n=1 Tax=Vibrio thalassae TaxID=1243014 RepID=A0A240EFD1_9VIBR|nr:hypothetical protein [Vibrio thalassae]SNX47231.1 hypothetical protein VTH8203_00832 [Vibrio thalassae]
MKHISKRPLAVVLTTTLMGCANESPTTSPESGALNQPMVYQHVESALVASHVTKPKGGNQIDTTKTTVPTKLTVAKPSNVMAQKPSAQTTKGVTVDATQSQRTTTKAYEVFDNETYEQVLTRWLDREGYAPFYKALNKNSTKVLKQKVGTSSVSYNTFDKATKQLLEQAKLNAWEMDWLSESAKVELGFRLLLDHESKTATLIGNPPSIKITGGKKVTAKKFHSAYAGETYETVLYRWLAQEGYVRVGKLLDEDETKVLKQTISSSQDFYGNFAAATTELMDAALLAARQNEKNERQGWISDEGKEGLQLYLRLNDLKKEAVLTSSKQPTYMFMVTSGSLKDNFLRLTDAYGWKATENQYLTQDYKVTFGYPIVTEQGNIKKALEILLADFPKLAGGIVPSTRTTYVFAEE